MRVLFFVFFALTVWQSALAQAEPRLYLYKEGGYFNATLKIREKIAFKHKGSDFISRGTIEGFTANSMIVSGTEVMLDTIAAISLKGRSFRGRNLQKAGFMVALVGVGIPALDLLNQGVLPSERMMVRSGSVVAAGAVIYAFHRRWFKPNKRYKMEVTFPKIEFDEE